MPNEDNEQKEQLLKLVRDAIQQDNELREKYNMGDKFRFIRDRLKALLTTVEEHFTSTKKKKEETIKTVAEDESLVYVYLYNTQGMILKTWLKMLSPSVFYEYSVNRPIYSDKSLVDAFIRSRTNKAHHAYLTIAVKKQNIFELGDTIKDAIGAPLVKVKEGSLKFDRLMSFTHNGTDYELTGGGELVVKPASQPSIK